MSPVIVRIIQGISAMSRLARPSRPAPPILPPGPLPNHPGTDIPRDVPIDIIPPKPIPFDPGDDGGDSEGESYEECAARCELGRNAGLKSCVQLFGPQSNYPDDRSLVSCVRGVYLIYEVCINDCITDCDH